MSLNETIFDNEVTLRYKVAHLKGVPSKYVLLINDNYITIQELITRELKEGKTFSSIFFKYRSILPSLEDYFLFVYKIVSEENPALTTEQLFLILSIVYQECDIILEYANAAQLTNRYISWIERMEILMSIDESYLRKVEMNQRRLQEVNRMVNELPQYDRVKIRYDIQIGDKKLDETDIDEVFDLCTLSYRVPLIVSVGPKKELGSKHEAEPDIKYKIFEGELSDQAPNISFFEDRINERHHSTIQMIVYTGVTDSSTDGKDVSYTVATFVFSSSGVILITDSPIRKNFNDEDMFRIVSEHLNFEVISKQEVEVGGSFRMFDLFLCSQLLPEIQVLNDSSLPIQYSKLDLVSFLDMILNDDLMSTYIYIDESGESAGQKTRLKIRLRSISGLKIETDKRGSSSTVSCHMLQDFSTSFKLHQVQYLNVHGNIANSEITLTPGTEFVKIVFKAKSRDLLSRFVELMMRLMGYYFYSMIKIENTLMFQKDAIFRFYSGFIPSIVMLGDDLTLPKENTKNRTVKQDVANYEELRNHAPEMFPKGYASIFQSKQQPKIISEEEVIEWESRTFVHKGVVMSYKAHQFPRPGLGHKSYWFVCPNPNYPFFGLKANETLENRDKFPYLPFCFEENQDVEGNIYRAYYNGDEITEQVKIGGKAPLKANKILDATRIGELPIQLRTLLYTYSEHRDKSTLYKLGVFTDPRKGFNSFLHAVLTACKVAEYSQEPSKSAFISAFRRKLAEMDLNVVKQELYDVDVKDIRRRLLSTDDWFNPQLFYRLVEEWFDINIFIFVPIQGSSTEFTIELPRAKLSHIRAKRDRKVVLLYKNTRISSVYPNYEVIIDSGVTGRSISSSNEHLSLFPLSMNNLCYEVLNRVMITATFNSTEVGPVTHLNLYNVNYETCFKAKPVSQFIDEYGKCRALTFRILINKESGPIISGGQQTSKTPVEKSEDYYFSVITPPQQPYMVPLGDPVESDWKILRQFLMEDPSYVHVNSLTGLMTGVWFSNGDNPYGAFIPLIPTSEIPEKIKRGESEPFTIRSANSSRISSIKRVSDTKKKLSFILQVIKFIFKLYHKENKGIKDIGLFLNTFFEVGNLTRSQYDLSRLPRRFPSGTVAEVLRYFEEKVPSLVRQGKIFLYNKTFADGVIHQVKEYYKSTLDLDLEPLRAIEGFYNIESDFIQRPYTLILIGNHKFREWKRSLVARSAYTKEATYSLVRNTAPIILGNLELGFFIVQNVKGNPVDPATSYQYALSIAYNWKTRRINTGFLTKVIPEACQQPFLVKAIDISGKLINIQTRNVEASIDGTDYLQILYLGDFNTAHRYAALLPLY